MRVNDDEYKNHHVFVELGRCSEFYKHLSASVFQFPSTGTLAVTNLDSGVYSSVQGTLDSIELVLRAGRINDAYALLRKYYDSVVTNIYFNLYLADNASIENFPVKEIDDWRQGRGKLPSSSTMFQYIKESTTLKPISECLFQNDRYKCLRDRCNDHMHYNRYRVFLLNDDETHLKDRGEHLDRFVDDLLDIFVAHLGFVFFLKDHYMAASNYVDTLDCDLVPEEGSQYWVAEYVQDIFREVIDPRHPDVSAVVRTHTHMVLS